MESRKLWPVGVIFLTMLFSGCGCFQWTDSLHDSAFVAACVRGNISLPWTFQLSSGETVEDIKWNFRSEQGQQELMAMLVGGTFLPLPTFSQRVQHLTNGGVVLSHVTRADTGNYTVLVAVRESEHAFSDYSKTAVIKVSDGLQVREDNDPVYDPVTDSWHLILSCGTVVNPQGSSDQVQWNTPSGALPSTSFENGHSYLQLENPIEGGNYTCELPQSSTATICPPLVSQPEPVLFVDEKEARIRLLEAENTALKSRVSHNEGRLTQIEASLASVQNQISQHVSFMARMEYNTNYPAGSAVIMTNVFSNQGNAYNITSGSFIAPYSGTYYFAASAQSHGNGKYADFYLKVDNRNVCWAGTQDSEYYDSSACHATLHLTAGERVWLQTYFDTEFKFDNTIFTGFLLSSDE